MKISKWIVLSVAGIATAVLLFYLLGNETSQGDETRQARYKEYTIYRGNFVNTVSASGVVIPIDRVEIKSKASGLIEELPVEEGDYVKKGALICRLDQTDVQAEVDQAQADLEIAAAELKQAENAFNRNKKLYEQNLLSEEELDNVDLQLAQAKGKMVNARIALEQANIRFDETIVVAPTSGIILQKYVEVGQIIASGINNVSGGTAIADIADMSKVYIEAGIDEIDVGKVSIGQTASVVTESFPNRTFEGSIIRVAPEATVEQNVTLFNVVIEVENPDGLLKSGMNATVEITIRDEENVLLVPTSVLSESQLPNAPRNARTVLKKEMQGYSEVTITIGAYDFNHAIILSGLEEGDVVAVPLTSRIMEENERMESRIKSTRGFGS